MLGTKIGTIDGYFRYTGVFLHLLSYIITSLYFDISIYENFASILHPRVTRRLCDILERIAEIKDIYISTNSPSILDYFDFVNRSKLVVFDLDSDGNTHKNELIIKEERLANPHFQLSKQWVQGHLGGVPNL
jgi:hypothetical protein